MGGQGLQDLLALQALPEVQIVAVCDVNRESGGLLVLELGSRKGPADLRTRTGTAVSRCRIWPPGALRAGLWLPGLSRLSRTARERRCRRGARRHAGPLPRRDHPGGAKRRKHVYCEKPLTYTVAEARQVTEAAREAKVATQLGNQGQAEESARLVQEMIADGAIGAVHEVQVWSPARFWTWPAWEGRPAETPPIPEGLDWDLWLGPAPERPYHPCYHPWTWRNWLDFGTGLLGDLGCHKLSTVFKALHLGHPTSVEASATKLSAETYPLGEICTVSVPCPGPDAAGDADLVRRWSKASTAARA